MAGTAIGKLVEKAIGEFISRALSERESERVMHVADLAVREIGRRIDEGERVRDDGFLPNEGTKSAKGSEVFESILLRSQREVEQRKLPYMAHLFAIVAFDSDISAPYAHQIVKMAEQLTYRQLCILKLAVFKEQLSLRTDYNDQTEFPVDLLEILYEFSDLYSKHLINFGDTLSTGLRDVRPASAMPQGMGVHIFYLMALREIPDRDILAIADRLQ